MIHIAVVPEYSPNDGWNKKRRVVGLEVSDVQTLTQGGLIKFETPTTDFYIALVRGTKEEFIAELNALSKSPNGHTDITPG